MFGRWPSSAAVSGCAEARRGEGQVEGREVLEREVPAPGRQVAASARRSRPVPSRCSRPSRLCRRSRRRGRARPGRGWRVRMRISGAAQSACAAGLGALEQDVAVLGRSAGSLPEHVGGRRGDPLEVRRRLAVPGGAAGDHVGEAVERAAREGVEVDRAVGVAGVERLLGVGRRRRRRGTRPAARACRRPSARRRRSGPGPRRGQARRGRSAGTPAARSRARAARPARPAAPGSWSRSPRR